MRVQLPCALVLFVVVAAAARSIIISNVNPRRDLNGELMDIHDGTILQFPHLEQRLYFFYGIGYGDCHSELNYGCAGEFGLGDCGFRLNHTINLYTSPDLVSWTFVRNILPVVARPEGIYFRPKIIYNSESDKYVLWVNKVNRSTAWHTPNFADTTYVIATSTTPDGEFSVVNADTNTTQYRGVGDLTLFVDDDQQAYVAYDAFSNLHTIQIERLAPDYLSSLGATASSSKISPPNNEAPIFFKRRGVYYLLFGACCCFCRSGSNARVFTASSPLGPWNDSLLDIDPMAVNGTKRVISGGQNSFVFSAELMTGAEQLIFVSDRWGSGAVMSEDMQYWQPLQFDDSKQPPSIMQLTWTDQFTLNLQIKDHQIY